MLGTRESAPDLAWRVYSVPAPPVAGGEGYRHPSQSRTSATACRPLWVSVTYFMFLVPSNVQQLLTPMDGIILQSIP